MFNKPQDTHVENVMDICRSTIWYFEQTYFSRYVSDYKAYLWYKWDRAKKILPWQSNIVIPLIASIVDTMYSSMYDSKMKFNILDHWKDWVQGTKWKDKILNKAFDYNNNWRDAVLSTIKEAIITWKWFIKPYFNSHQEEIIIHWKNYGKTIKRPELAYLSVFDVFYDYNSSIDDSPFFIERHILSKNTILKRYTSTINQKNPEKAKSYIASVLEKTKKEWARYSNYDYNRVRNILAYEDLIINSMKNTTVETWTTVWERNKSENTWGSVDGVHSWSIEHLNNIFWVDFESNKVYEVIEYNDDWNWTVLIDWVKLFNKKVKTITNKIYDISFNEIPWTSDSTWISSNIWDLNLMINTLQNLFLDGLKMNTSPMYEQVWGLNQMLGNKNKVVYEPFKIVPTNTAGSLKKIEMGLGWFEPVNAVQFLEGMAEKRVWVNEYIIWGQGKVERVSGWVDLIFNQYKSKLMPLTNSVNQAMGRISKAFLIMYATYYTKDELKELGIEWELDIADLINEDDITFQLTSLALLAKEEWIKHLLDNLGAIGNFMGGSESPNINSKELIRAILTKEVDIDALIPDKTPFHRQPDQWAPQWPWAPQSPQWGWGPLAAMMNTLTPNQ